MTEATNDSKTADVEQPEMVEPVTRLFKIRCRVNGELQAFHCEATSFEEAIDIVKTNVLEAKPILVLI